MNELEERIYKEAFGNDKVDCVIGSFRQSLVKTVIDITHEGGLDFEYLCVQLLKQYIEDEYSIMNGKSGW